ncbi:MAG TPA: radical SAM protein [Candidatus Hydrogenedentes bacterium]|nr:radical SAM protein [Candidatus Hydrogenedentota bacterium]HOV72351.1 radical SAM protein [Candidatus Hydrogenedentota bacterium]
MTLENDTLPGRLRRWKNGETPGPWNLMLFPTNRCNLRCIMCWRNHEATRGLPVLPTHEIPLERRNNPHKELSDDRLLEIVDEAAALGCRDWLIQGGGEPLLRASLVLRICERIRSHGMNGKLITNATLLEPEHMQAFVEMGWDFVACSLDGPTAAINDPLRGAGTFDAVTAAVAQCAALRRAMNAKRPLLQLLTTVTRHNHDVLPAMVELAHRLGCDSVQAGLTVVHYGLEHLITREQHKALPAIIEKANRRAQELGIEADYDHIARNPWGSIYLRKPWACDESPPPGMEHIPCFCPWYSIAIFADGRVAQCSMNWQEKAPSVMNAPLKEAWESAYFGMLRERMAGDTPLECCHLCPSILDARSPSMRIMDKAYLDGTIFE